MKPKYFEIISRAVEEGVNYGWRRAHKHVDTPSEEAILDSIATEVMNAMCEYFGFADEQGAND